MNIVIVDDSVLVRARLERLLAENPRLKIVGHAGNSGEALQVITERKPEAVILDISMPGENGIEALKKIKNINKNIVVIILTNYTGKQFKASCYKAGADYFFDKSLEFQLVPDVLGELQRGHLYYVVK